MAKSLNIIPDKCTGYMQCELACSWVQTGTFQPSRSVIRVNVFDEEASYAPFTCVQCDEAWCMNACPVNAIAVDPQESSPRFIDPTGGLDDLVDHRIRVASGAAFNDDPLRLLRAVRFSVQLGFDLDGETRRLASAAAPEQHPATTLRWWPNDLAVPSASGAHNEWGYACSPNRRRLAVIRDGRGRVCDTGEHRIGGFSQQQSSTQNLSFSSQLGTVHLQDLKEA